MTVNQGSNRAVIDWTSFNVGSQAKVQFNQPSANAVTLNNILGNNASQIYGQISANGQVFLSNPNGVYFSPTAQVNVGGLVATTGKANADEFMAGKATFNRNGSTGSVVNEGQLSSAAGGYIALLAPEVRNQGVVIAQAGTVALASGEAITLSFNNSGTGLAGITTTPQTIAALVENRSAVLAEGGQIILSAHALATLQGSVVKNSGQLSATSLSEKGGKIVLMGDNIELTGTSRIEANGPQGGGTVLVGGDWQGQGDMRQAVQVTMAQGASIEANATQQGDGGKVVLWSDVHNANSVTKVDGRIEAKGAGSANEGGNGGQVETSGHTLNVGESTRVSTQATGQGKSGQWLLDPVDFNINSGSGGQTSSSIGATTLATNLRSTDVIIATDASTAGNGDININAAVSPVMDLADHTLTLQAHRDINIKASIDATTSVSSIYKLNVLFKSVRNIVQYNTGDASALVAVKTNGGNATYWSNSNNTNSGAIQIGTNSTFATASVVTNGGNIVLGGGLPSSGNNNIPDGYAYGTIESPRVLRRLHTLRRWSHEQEIKPFFT
jgi:filamentous hemagglutinin family protein